MTGAPAIAALGAFRSGCGLVTVGLRKSLPFIEKPLEVMTLSWDEVLEQDIRYKAIVFGPGLSTAPDGLEFLVQLIGRTEAPLVIDADGLNLLADNPDLLGKFNQPIVLTPHPGEMARLTGCAVSQIQQDRIGIARQYACEWRVTVVLKGARTVIALPDGRVFINLTGNPAMATAGMGDLLAGMIGGLIAQGVTVESAAVLGPYLHGLAGDAVCSKKGPAGIIASDLLDEIPGILKKVLTNEQA
jgi:NAD(P)H-hydrate epimerase